MPINAVIHEKRKALGYTQEQVATYLGVSTPAVNKWERGVTYPDITLLSPLARLLKIDLNTLLCFREELSEQEIYQFVADLSATLQRDGVESGFAMAMEKLQVYPSDPRLTHSTALLLDGALIMLDTEPEKRQAYKKEVLALYERAAEGGDCEIRASASYMLASEYISQDRLELAQAMLDRLPERSTLDKRLLEAELLIRQGKLDEAAQQIERRLLTDVTGLQNLLLKLADMEIRQKNNAAAARLAELAQKTAKLYDLWDYAAYVVPFEVATAQEDIQQSLSILEAMLPAVQRPWNASESPLYRHMRAGQGQTDADGYLAAVLPRLLSELETNPKLAFLQAEPGFKSLIRQYRSKIER